MVGRSFHAYRVELAKTVSCTDFKSLEPELACGISSERFLQADSAKGSKIEDLLHVTRCHRSVLRLHFATLQEGQIVRLWQDRILYDDAVEVNGLLMKSEDHDKHRYSPGATL